MSLEINLKQDAKSWPQHISLQDGESLQVLTGEIFQIIDPENVAQLVPQAKDLQIVCHDGSSYILKSFMDTEFSQEPMLELKEGTSITWHDFVQQTDGVDMDDMPDDQYSQHILFVPLHVIALASESQKWGFTQVAPEPEKETEGPGPAVDQQQAESQPEEFLEQSDDYQATSAETTDERSSTPIEQDPLPVSGQSDEDQEDRNGLASYTTSTQLDEIEIDIREFIPQMHEEEIPDDLTITAKFQEGPKTEIEVDPKDGVLRLPGSTFDDGGQRRLTVTINDKNGETETEITITETKDGGGEAFHLILSHNQVAENIGGALIGKLDTDDSGRGGNYTYKIAKDDYGLFEIDGNVLKLKDGVSIDYEARPANYPVIISSTDENGNRVEQTLSVWPEDVNEAATVSSVGIQSFEDLVVKFQPEPFENSFEDEDSDYLEMIRIDTLPDNGVLLLDGSKVTNGQLVDIGQVEELSFHPDINWNGNTDFTWSGFDGQSWSSDSSPVNIYVSSVNDAPVVQVYIGSESIIADAAFSLELPANAFVDVDTGDTLTYSAALPSWLSINPTTGKLSGIPGEDAVGEHEITITATDSAGAAASQSFTVSVAHANTAPTLTPIANQSTDEDAFFNFDASEHFQDSDEGDTLTYSATKANGDPLPSWLSIDEHTGELSGTPADGDDDTISITVTASDGEAQIQDTFSVTVNDSITGADPDRNINGGNGAQTIVTGSGNDTIDGGNGADIISIRAGDDNILGGSGADNIDAGSGDDVIDGGVGSDFNDPGSGNDTIYATEGQETIHAGEGYDTFTIDDGKNFGDLFGGDGEDTIQLEGSDITLDFSKVNNDVTNVESLDIDGSSANSLKLTAEDVLDMTDGDNRLFIDGGSDDSVEISDSFVSEGTENIGGVDYTHCYDAGTDSHLYINNDISSLDTF